MTKKLILLRGLPASNKSTWSKGEVEKANAIRFNKDDIRKELFPDGWVYNKNNEALVVATERERVEYTLMTNHEYVIVDNTHLGTNNKHIKFYKELAKKYGYQFSIRDFIISVEEAIKRDNLRSAEDRVGEEVIRRLAKTAGNKGYPAEPIYRPYKEGLSYAIIVDIDGTVAFKGDRNPYDYSRVSEDRPNLPLILQITALRSGWLYTNGKSLELFFVSGRDDNCKAETNRWLKDNGFVNYKLLMRKTGDVRGDDIVKEEIYKENILNKYNVLSVFDDRQKVVDCWRSLGLPVCQVNYGFF